MCDRGLKLNIQCYIFTLGSGLLGKQSTDPLAGEGSLSGVTVVGQQNVRGMCYGDIKGRQCVDPLGGKARVTQAECCKTFGKGWGDSCFMCPHMLGNVWVVAFTRLDAVTFVVRSSHERRKLQEFLG